MVSKDLVYQLLKVKFSTMFLNCAGIFDVLTLFTLQILYTSWKWWYMFFSRLMFLLNKSHYREKKEKQTKTNKTINSSILNNGKIFRWCNIIILPKLKWWLLHKVTIGHFLTHATTHRRTRSNGTEDSFSIKA